MNEMPQYELDHKNMVKYLAKSGSDILNSLTSADCHLIHMAMGVAGEAGELLDAIKKHTMYRKPIDMANVIEELGDIEFYMEGLRAKLGITRAQVLAGNVAKLSVRYKAGYSDAAAQERADKSADSSGLPRPTSPTQPIL